MNRGLRLAAYRAFALRAGDNPITSSELSELTGVNATMVRRDMAEINAHGQQGVGYQPDVLVAHLEAELHRIGWAAVLEDARAQMRVLKLVVRPNTENGT